MENIIADMKGVPEKLGGFHQYSLDAPVHLCYVSQSLCNLLGVGEAELLSETGDLYQNFVHLEDREAYHGFIAELAEEEITLSLEYRLVTKSGEIRWVSDEAVSKRNKDGVLVGSSVLCDITKHKEENTRLHMLKETVPCGFICYTCAKQPKVTYLNDYMLQVMRFPERKEGEPDPLELYQENIYLMIPMEERPRFAVFLSKVRESNVPLAGEMTVLRCDGTRARLIGWIAKGRNSRGEEEFQSVCIDVSERYDEKRNAERSRFLRALCEVYESVLEYDFSKDTVSCLYGEEPAFFRGVKNIPMQMRTATEKWIESTVVETDRGRVLEFFCTLFSEHGSGADARPPQIRYRAVSARGQEKTCLGIFLRIDGRGGFFCCRSETSKEEVSSLRDENIALKSLNENMEKLVMNFSEGIAAFEVNGEFVTPLYSSDNVCEFFGFRKDEWLSMMQKKTPIELFVSRGVAAYEDILKLLKEGEAEFTYYDVKREEERRIKAICSRKLSDGTSRFVMLYNIDGKENQNGEGKKEIYIRTFGYFDVFVDGSPIAFRSQKAKELFALLVDRKGGFVSSEEAISFLWEDEMSSAVVLARYRKTALRLKNILAEYGIADVIESADGKRRLVTNRVKCDLYDYLSGREEYAQLFKGSYLTNYSWGENTLGELTGSFGMF